MSNYDDDMFDDSTDSATTRPTDDDYDITKWGLGKHQMPITGIDPAKLREAAAIQTDIDDELAGLLETAAARVDGISVNDFQCPACKLSHGHADDKHDIRPTFNVTPEFAEMMQFHPACHCGVNELAMLMDFYGGLSVQVFTDDDKFEAFDALMPSEEASDALALYSHPDITVMDSVPRARYRVTTDHLRSLVDGRDDINPRDAIRTTVKQIFDAARLPNEEAARDAFVAFTERYRNIQSAAANAPIPDDTAAEPIERERGHLEARFDDQ